MAKDRADSTMADINPSAEARAPQGIPAQWSRHEPLQSNAAVPGTSAALLFPGRLPEPLRHPGASWALGGLLLVAMSLPSLLMPLLMMGLGAAFSAVYFIDREASDRGLPPENALYDDCKATALETADRASMLSSSSEGSVELIPIEKPMVLCLDRGGPLDSVVMRFREYVVRDFVLPWYQGSIAAPGSAEQREQFPRAVRVALDTIIMKMANRCRERGARDMMVHGTSRIATHVVRHLRLARHLHSEASHPAVVHAKEETSQATRVRKVAHSLLKSLLPSQDAASGIVLNLLTELMANSVLWPVVKVLSEPKFINGAIVSALSTSKQLSMADPADDNVMVDFRITLKFQSARVFSKSSKQLELQASLIGQEHAICSSRNVEGDVTFDESIEFVFPYNMIGSDDLIILSLRESDGEGGAADHGQGVISLVNLPFSGLIALNGPEGSVVSEVLAVVEPSCGDDGLMMEVVTEGDRSVAGTSVTNADDLLNSNLPWTLAKIMSDEFIAKKFRGYLRDLQAMHLLDFYLAAEEYQSSTSKFDLANTESRAIIQQKAYDLFDSYLGSSSALALPPELSTRLEERIVLDPNPGLFNPVLKLVREQINAHVSLFERRERTEQSIKPAMLASMPPRPTPARYRSMSFSFVPRSVSTVVSARSIADFADPAVDAVLALATKQAQLVEGVRGYDTAFTSSCMVTLQMQLFGLQCMLDRLESPRNPDVEDDVHRLQMHKAQVEAKLMTVEALISGESPYVRRGSSFSNAEGSQPSRRASPNHLSADLEKLSSQASMLTTSMGKNVKNVFKGLAKEGRLQIGSAWQQRTTVGDSLKRNLTSLRSGFGGIPSLSSGGRRREAGSGTESPPALPSRNQVVRSNSSTPPPLPQRSSTAPDLSEAVKIGGDVPPLPPRRGHEEFSSIPRSSSPSQLLDVRSQQEESTEGLEALSPKQVAIESFASLEESIARTSPMADVNENEQHAMSSRDTDTVIESVFMVVKTVFGLEGTLRARIFAVIKQVLRPRLASLVHTQFTQLTKRIEDQEFIAESMDKGVLQRMWPGGVLCRQQEASSAPDDLEGAEDPAAIASRAGELLDKALPDTVAHLLGKQNALAGLQDVHALLQVEALNRALVISVIESVVEVLVLSK